MAGAGSAGDTKRRSALLGQAVLAARTRRRMGVRELARKIEVSASLISRIEKGTVMPSVGTLFALADALEVAVTEILGGDGRRALDQPPPAPAWPAGSQGVQRRDQRDAIDLESGARWERLTPGPDPIQFTYSVYRPGEAS